MHHYSTTRLPDRMLDEPFLPSAKSLLLIKNCVTFFWSDLCVVVLSRRKQFFYQVLELEGAIVVYLAAAAASVQGESIDLLVRRKYMYVCEVLDWEGAA